MGFIEAKSGRVQFGYTVFLGVLVISYIFGHLVSRCGFSKLLMASSSLVGIVGTISQVYSVFWWQTNYTLPEEEAAKQKNVEFRLFSASQSQDVIIQDTRPQDSKGCSNLILIGLACLAFTLAMLKSIMDNYIQKCTDKQYVLQNFKGLNIAQILGAGIGLITTFYVSKLEIIVGDIRIDSFTAPALLISLVMIILLFIVAFGFQEVTQETRESFEEFKKYHSTHKKKEQDLKKQIEESTLMSYDEWTKMKQLDPDNGPLYLGLYFLFVVNFALGLVLCQAGAFSTKINDLGMGKQTHFTLLAGGQFVIFACFVTLGLFSQTISHQKLILVGLGSLCLASLNMVTVSHDNLTPPAYCASVLLIHVAYLYLRSSTLKMLMQSAGTNSNFMPQLCEYIGLFFGGFLGSLSVSSSFSYSYLILLLLSLMGLLLGVCCRHALTSVHWTYMIERQEQIIKAHYTDKESMFGLAALYESLDSMDPTKELPVFVGHQDQSMSKGSIHL